MITRRQLQAMMVMLVLLSAGPAGPAAASFCGGGGDEVPPFLGTAPDPNLLLIFDNSASMYDLAYQGGKTDEETGEFRASICYDESYDLFPGRTYVGYFDQTKWYQYDLTNHKFQPYEGSSELACAGSEFVGTGVCLSTQSYLDAEGKQIVTLTYFRANGNYLNWATASRMDIAKQVLTGGKHDGSSMLLESRGCAGKRFVKQVEVKSGGNTYWLVMATRPEESRRWKSGWQYYAGEVARDLGGWYRALVNVRSPTQPANDPARWQPIDYLSYVEIFAPTAEKFDNFDCEEASRLMAEGGAQGTIKTHIDKCLKYSEDVDDLNTKMSVFNHSLNDCWWAAKQGSWDGYGQGSLSRIKNGCQKLYRGGWDPHVKNPSDSAYVCYGKGWHNPTENKWKAEDGFVGTCWHKTNDDWTTTAVPPYDSLPSGCLIEALKAYCAQMQVPEVVDPSDIMTDTSGFFNLPTSLVDAGVLAQQGTPIATLKGILHEPDPPEGLIHDYIDQIRIGAMVFNDNGAKTECTVDGQILYDCNITGNRDGGRVISNIGSGPEHVADLAAAINAVKATTWTPLAEGVFNAVGYYTQRSDLRLNTGDFTISAAANPVQYYCQDNHIILLSDGASTADRASMMTNVIPAGTFEAGFCDPLKGSSHLKRLTDYARNGDIYNGALLNGHSRKNIATHIVATGARSTENAECSPIELLREAAEAGGTELYEAEIPEELEAKLEEAFYNIRAGAAAGSATSVISSSRTGEGAVYQAVFWPQMETLEGQAISWVGEVHALFVDAKGQLYEDTDGVGTMNQNSRKVFIYYDREKDRSMACYGTVEDFECDGERVEISEVRYLWSASDWLSGLSDADVRDNRNPSNYTDEEKRYIFTWNDLDGSGIVRDDEVLVFDRNLNWTELKNKAAGREVYRDLRANSSGEANMIIDWLRGVDQTDMRPREFRNRDNQLRTWRLGDVVHSTPTAVSRPAEGYHLLYRDFSYAEFAGKYNGRRHVIYFGANDGMLHAVNGGFYRNGKFCTTETCTNSGLPLGAELWAYVPYNLWPHLKCLTDPGYSHKYYVDMVPRVFDVRIFKDSSTHKNGWGTILVGGMRFGGVKVNGAVLSGDDENDHRVFTSAYFILDITDPEEPPRLLAEMTFTNNGNEAEMGFTTAMPTVVPMVKGTESNWYLILGSGPTNLRGESTQTGKVAVVDLKALVDEDPASRKPFRIPDRLPTASDQRGRFELEGHPNSFVSDLVTVDFEFNYLANAVYFGTGQGNFDNNGYWAGGGRLYRLVTEMRETSGQVPSRPDQWHDLFYDPFNWDPTRLNPSLLLETDRPITAAPSVGWDGRNYWVYFGSGRLFIRKDLDDFSWFSYYGVKEPRALDNETCSEFTWETVSLNGTHNDGPGQQGLLRVDEILVKGHPLADSSTLSCKPGTSGCLAWADVTRPSFADLREHIVGTCVPGHTGKDGWYRKLDAVGERNLGQATLLGGLLTYTAFLPSTDACSSLGESFLYGLFFQTGTSYHRSVFGDTVTGDNVTYKISVGPGLALTPNLHVGSQPGATAYVQTSTGAIVGISQPALPFSDFQTGRQSWREVD